MKCVRLTIRHNPHDPAEDLRYAAKVRFDLWKHSPVEIDPDSRASRTRRDEMQNAYFEFVTDLVDEVKRVLSEYGHSERVQLAIVDENVGEECQKCGKVSGPVLPTVCPACGHRDIDPCPHCGEEVPRQEYHKISGDIFECPRCRGRVRFQLNPDLWSADQTLNEPVVVVSSAEA